MAVKMLSRGPAGGPSAGSNEAVRQAVRTKSSEYASAPTDHARQASELAKKIREVETKPDTHAQWTVRGRASKPGLFK